MLLTAGLGTRLRPVTDYFAKPAVPFLNVPLLCYSLALLKQAGVSELTLNTHYKPEQVIEAAKRFAASDFRLHFSHEPNAPLGSGGGIRNARRSLEGEGSFLVANGDEVILPRAAGVIPAFIKQHQDRKAFATILVMEHPHVGTQFGGVWADAHGRVLGFGRDRTQFPNAHTGYHYIGLLLLSERVFAYLPEGESNILYDALTTAIASGETVEVCVSDFTWYETGNARDFLAATDQAIDLYQDGAGEDAKLLRTIIARYSTRSMRVFQSPRARVFADSTLAAEIFANCEGFVVVSPDAQLEVDARLKNAVLLPGARALSGDSIHDQVVCPVSS